MNDAELIKSKIDIVDFLSEHITLKKAGRNFKALCPFHSEKTPSFHVSPERQTWYCFGACHEGGDVISFLQKWEGLEFVEALEILARRAGVTISKFTPTDGSRLKEKLHEINHLASEFYHYILTTHALGARARQYLIDRHIKKETIKTFGLGYAPDSWDSLSRYLTRKGYKMADISEAGLLVKTESGRFYDRFRGRLIFTLRDIRGSSIGFSGRVLPPIPEKSAKYINTPETPIYVKGTVLYGMDVTREAIKKTKEAVVVEGEFDFLASFQSGVSNVVAIKGSALTEAQTMLLKRYTDKVVLALDHDFAGNEAARRGIDIAENAGLTVRVAELPYGKDPAECIEKSPHLWQSAVKDAVTIYDFILKTALSRFDKNDVLGKQSIGAMVVPFLAKIVNPIVQSHYVKLLSRELGVTEESIDLSIRTAHKKFVVKTIAPASHTNISREELLEQQLLSLIVQAPNPKQALAQTSKILATDDYTLLPVRQIIELLTSYFKKHDAFDAKLFGAFLTPEISPGFDRAYLTDIDNILSDEHKFAEELIRTVSEIKKIALRRRIGILSTKLHGIEEGENMKEAEGLNEEIRILLEELRSFKK
jgi:DNA primase